MILQSINHFPIAVYLWRILHGINLSQQQYLAGLDDVTAAAMTGFETLKNVSDFFKRTDLN